MSTRLAATRLVKVRGERRWKAVPAYTHRAPSPAEIAGLLHRVEHDLTQAAEPEAAPALRFRASAQAAFHLTTIVLRASGYETHPPLDPKSTFEALRELFGAEGRALSKSFATRYRKSRRSPKAEKQASLGRDLEALSKDVEDFRAQVTEWLASRHPDLAPQ